MGPNLGGQISIFKRGIFYSLFLFFYMRAKFSLCFSLSASLLQNLKLARTCMQNLNADVSVHALKRTLASQNARRAHQNARTRALCMHTLPTCTSTCCLFCWSCSSGSCILTIPLNIFFDYPVHCQYTYIHIPFLVHIQRYIYHGSVYANNYSF
jgi:hypothetical protein